MGCFRLSHVTNVGDEMCRHQDLKTVTNLSSPMSPTVIEVGTITKLFSIEKEDVEKLNPRIRECQRG